MVLRKLETACSEPLTLTFEAIAKGGDSKLFVTVATFRVGGLDPRYRKLLPE